jgi:hypothetical protein
MQGRPHEGRHEIVSRPAAHRSVCAAGQPAGTQVGRGIGLSGSDREFPPLTGRSGTQRARAYLGDHLIRRYLCGYPDPFRSVRDLGLVPARCSGEFGISESRSPRWLPAWLPVAEGLPHRSACRGPSARRGGLPVRLTRSKRGRMLSCVDERAGCRRCCQPHGPTGSRGDSGITGKLAATCGPRISAVAEFGEGSPRLGLPGPTPHSQGTQE